MPIEKKLAATEREVLIGKLKNRFEKNRFGHKGFSWDKVQERLENSGEKLWSLHEMERTGGEPELIGRDDRTGEYFFFDCSKESPASRRSTCYDQEALESRKKHKPDYSAIGMAAEMGVELLSEAQYRDLQKLGSFDTKTSSWLKTPPDVRALGGAIFGDYRYGKVFVYHNGASSYYASRGFRAWIKI